MTHLTYSSFEKEKLAAWRQSKLLENLIRNPSNGSRHEQAIEDFFTAALRESATAAIEAVRVEKADLDKPTIGYGAPWEDGRNETISEIDQKAEHYLNT